jgi:hypothetical protein
MLEIGRYSWSHLIPLDILLHLECQTPTQSSSYGLLRTKYQQGTKNDQPTLKKNLKVYRVKLSFNKSYV